MTDPTPIAAEPSRRAAPSERRKAVLAVVAIAAPFLIVSLALHGLTQHIQTFFGEDEQTYHLPAIAKFAASFPRFDLRDYGVAMTPGYHLLFATIVAVLHPPLPALRGLNVAIGFGATLTVLAMLRRHFGFDWRAAALAALAWGLSPYVFGPSFLVLTDNLAYLLSWLSLLLVLEHRRGGTTSALVASVGLGALAVLTRQTTIWLLPAIYLIAAGERGASLDKRVAILLLCALSLLPLAILAALWGGLNPPAFQKHAGLNPRNLTFMLAQIGFYALPMLALEGTLWSQLRRRPLPYVAAGAVVILWLALWPLAFTVAAVADGGEHVFATNGYLWRFTRWAPRLGETNIALGFLALVGSSALVLAWRRVGPLALGPMVAMGFAAASLASRPLYGKYFDPIALMAVLLILAQATTLSGWRRRLLLSAYMAFGLAYLVLEQFGPHG